MLELKAVLSSQRLSQPSFCTRVKVIKEAAPDTLLQTGLCIPVLLLPDRPIPPSFRVTLTLEQSLEESLPGGYTKTHLPSWPMILNSLSGLREKEVKSKLSSLTQPPLCHLPSLLNSLPLIPSALNSSL